jgi:hypothetical protein
VKGKTVAQYVERELAERLSNPLVFKWSASNANTPPAVVYGYDATMLIDLCKAVITAAADGKLLKSQGKVVAQAHIILNASAKTGIRGLVYALAGYDQTRDEVITAFKLYVQEEARQYEKEFPDQLYEAWVRLYALHEPPRGKNWKHKDLTVKHVYTPLAQSNGRILELTRALKAQSKARSAKLHQFLSEIGVKALRTHLGRLTGMAEVATDRAEYERFFEKVFGRQLSLDLPT